MVSSQSGERTGKRPLGIGFTCLSFHISVSLWQLSSPVTTDSCPSSPCPCCLLQSTSATEREMEKLSIISELDPSRAKPTTELTCRDPK
ncbi:unnamed protein product [Gadus morhua 'NCC']